MDDQALIERFLAGDVAAFNTLVWRWEKPIYNFVFRYVGTAEAAKEVTQQTFIRAYTGLRRLKNTACFSTWLHQIALNLSRDELKRRRPLLSLDGEHCATEEGHSLPSELSDLPENRPDCVAHNSYLAAVLKRAVLSLPEEQRVVIIMKQYQGLKFREIADVLAQPVNTVKSRLYHGLVALRRILEEWGVAQEVLDHEM
ncbi:MAG: sigma-70 family RNA polymerase sigma factor [bacterium]|jgi:RNA polymerase sigma-70 factor (ECF subfamily)|nr:sigma-70 family RNA polymerase sigma factor [candidate division KSB1 bacterium]MDH7561256.1 sigma-70 family RNA polymerase sigma factor [bacterium]